MRHISIPSNSACEVLDFTPINPLISKCQIKVCYVGEEPNRNRSVITKEVATEMAKSLPGCPIVGFFNEAENDYEEHNRVIDVSNGKFDIKDLTRPYGFVSMDAKVWFQKFRDDGIEHEYLCTEGYIWTKVYPESERIITHGNNQSMELDDDVKGTWAERSKDKPPIFIINEALISKLCILGENVEPCFEGAQIAREFSLSLDENFKQQVFSMINELKEVLSKGGTSQMDEDKSKVLDTEEQSEKMNEEENLEFKKKEEEEENKNDMGKNEEEDNSNSEEEKKDEKSSDSADEPEDKKDEDNKEDEKKKKKYSVDSLEEIPEYVELNNKFSQLTADFENLSNEVAELRQFKAESDRKEKEAMIASFYMLSDADKKDCLDNIDTYSLNDIEAKLSIICVHNKVSFDLDDNDKQDDKPSTVYSLAGTEDDDNAPAWIKAVRSTAKSL